MSTTQYVRSWGDVAQSLRRTSAKFRGCPLEPSDDATHAEAIALCCCLLVDLRNRCGLIGPDREIIAWAHNMRSLDVVDLGTVLADGLVALRSIHKPTSYSRFKASIGSSYTGMVLAPARAAFEAFLEDPQAKTFMTCNQFLSFLSHLTLEHLDLVEEQEQGYVELERTLQSQSEDPIYQRRLEYLSAKLEPIMREWMGGLVTDDSINPFRPRHGKGAVFSMPRSSSVADKYRAFSADRQLFYIFMQFAGVDISTLSPYNLTATTADRTCEIISVPKSMLKRRIISKEPALLQYLQQGVRRWMYNYVHAHPYLSRHIAFNRQDLNGQLALMGSVSGRYATIDLSAASDRVTVDIVERLFRNTSIYPFLSGTRSVTAALPSGRTVPLQKFAPMGSAVCFPVQTLVFACAVEYAVRRARATNLGDHPEWRVYGDDIIVEDAVYFDVLLVLEALGFVVNEAKSYGSPFRFRESCGMEAYDGIDVTPLRISRRFMAVETGFSSRHAPQYMGYVSACNNAYAHSLPTVRAYLLDKLLEGSHVPPLFAQEGRGALRSWVPNNWRAARRFNTSWQVPEIRVRWVRTDLLKREDGTDSRPQGSFSYLLDHEEARDDRVWLFETLRTTATRRGDMFDPAHRTIVPRGSVCTKLSSSWTVEPPFTVRS